MTGDGRADYVTIAPDNGSLSLWINRCWEIDNGGGTGGGDDGGASGPSHTTRLTCRVASPKCRKSKTSSQDFIPAKAGDVFIYDFEDDSNKFVEVVLVGEAEDFPDIDCGVHDVRGEDGNVLSCEAQGVAWLFYSIYQLGEPIRDDLTRRDSLEARRVNGGPRQGRRRTRTARDLNACWCAMLRWILGYPPPTERIVDGPSVTTLSTLEISSDIEYTRVKSALKGRLCHPFPTISFGFEPIFPINNGLRETSQQTFPSTDCLRRALSSADSQMLMAHPRIPHWWSIWMRNSTGIRPVLWIPSRTPCRRPASLNWKEQLISPRRRQPSRISEA